MNKRKKGKYFEDTVCRYLAKNGYEIIDQNFTIWGGEIDIIAKKDERIIFVEVKSLYSDSILSLEETITQKKKLFLIRSCQTWLDQNNLQNSEWRIDFVGIKFDNYDKITNLKHIKNAVY